MNNKIQNYVSDIEYSQLWDNLYSNEIDKLPWVTNPYPATIFNEFKRLIGSQGNFLDYGCGVGRYYNLLNYNELNTYLADISEVALLICKNKNFRNLINTDSPAVFESNFFNGILLWGVLHHISPIKRFDFWKNIHRILKKNGVILIGGWNSSDIEFNNRSSRKSKITNSITWSIDLDSEFYIEKFKLNTLQKGVFEFTESVTNKDRIFSYYLLQKS